MIYVMSDIHGCYDEFIKMLEKIDFKDEDTLYILGDVIDRGPKPLKILDYVIEHPNIKMLLGNHEHLLLKYFKTMKNKVKGFINKINWIYIYSGGFVTLNQLETLSLEQQEKYINFLDNLSLYQKININNENYILVHAGLRPYKKNILKKQKKKNLLYIRSKFLLSTYNLPFIVIFGHTRIQRIYENYMKKNKQNDFVFKNYYVYLFEKIMNIKKKYSTKDINVKILKLPNKIAIDCGCYGGGKLACLRLDDMKEFYVENKIIK